MGNWHKVSIAGLLVVWLCCLMLGGGCSSGNKLMIIGKWRLVGGVTVGPGNFWFRGDGTVQTEWETWSSAVSRRGTYEFTDDTHVRIDLEESSMGARSYTYEIVNLNREELILRIGQTTIELQRVE